MHWGGKGRKQDRLRPSTRGVSNTRDKQSCTNPDKSGVHSFLGLTMSPKSPDHSRKQEEMQMHRQEVALPTPSFSSFALARANKVVREAAASQFRLPCGLRPNPRERTEVSNSHGGGGRRREKHRR